MDTYRDEVEIKSRAYVLKSPGKVGDIVPCLYWRAPASCPFSSFSYPVLLPSYVPLSHLPFPFSSSLFSSAQVGALVRVIGAEVSSQLVDVMADRVTRGGEMHLLKDALHRCDVVGAYWYRNRHMI